MSKSAPPDETPGTSGGDAVDARILIAELVQPIREFSRQIGRLTFGNFAAISALVAGALYVVGLVRRVAQLHAEGVATSRGLGLSSLQDYLLEGLAVVVNPTTAALLVVLLILAGAAFLYAALSGTRIADLLARFLSDQDASTHKAVTQEIPLGRVARAAPEHPSLLATYLSILLSLMTIGVGVVFLLGLLLVVPVANWGPGALGVLPVAGVVLINGHYGFLEFDGLRSWSMDHARAVVYCCGITLVLIVTLFAYFDPPSLDRAEVRTLQGRHLVGELLSTSGGDVYLVGTRGHDGQASIVVIPTTSVSTMRISEGGSRFYKTIPELLKLPKLLGVPFWRLELSSGDSIKIVRTGGRSHPE
jgi:hypothetical protein